MNEVSLCMRFGGLDMAEGENKSKKE